MSTLNQLVNETTNIKNEIINCNGELKKILQSKNVSVSIDEKLISLIYKVNSIQDVSKYPEWAKKSSDTWIPCSTMDSYKSGVGTGSFGSNIYIAGGRTGSGTSNNTIDTVEVYDCSKNTTRYIASLPSKMADHGGGTINGYVYFTCGSGSESSSRVSVNYQLNPNTETWTQKASIPSAAGGWDISTTVVGDRLYTYGGCTGTSIGAGAYYNTVSNEWTILARSTISRCKCTISAVGENIYIFGGFVSPNTSTLVSESECFNTKTETYTTKTNIPTSRGYLTSCVVGTNVYVIGGAASSSYGGEFSVNECYHTETNTWTTKSKMPTARRQLSSVVVEDKIYVIGGMYAGYRIGSNECYVV